MQMFAKGCKSLIVATDHKPRIGIFGNSVASISNPQITKFKEKTLPYKFSIQHNPVKWIKVADAFS